MNGSGITSLAPVEIKGYSIRFGVSLEGVFELFEGDRSGVVTVGGSRHTNSKSD